MTEYKVTITQASSVSTVRVEARKFEIEGGVLVFHENPDKTGTLKDMTADNKIRAFNEWSEVERV